MVPRPDPAGLVDLVLALAQLLLHERSQLVLRTTCNNHELIKIDDRDYRLEVRRLQKEIEQSKNSLAELEIEENNIMDLVRLAEEDLKLQEKEVQRIRDLKSKRAASVIARQASSW